VKGLGKGKTASESFAIVHQRQNLQAKVDRFQSQGLALVKGDPSKLFVGSDKQINDLDGIDLADPDDEDDWLMADVEETMEEEEPEITPEGIVLYLPSNFTLQQRKEYGLQELANLEYELREGQANDSLERLRECLAEKSLRFRTQIRPAKSQKTMARAWDSVYRKEGQIKQAVITYRTARRAIGELGDASDLERFQEIQKSDLKMSGDIVEENRVGQRSSVLPWFWRLDRKAKGYCGSYEKECKCSKVPRLQDFYLQDTVYRVNWLRARARAQRWNEEKEIVVKEMECVIRTFKHMEELWERRAEKMEGGKLGHKAYAARETDRWKRWVDVAEEEFSGVTGRQAFL
jgi:hypothetical protein